MIKGLRTSSIWSEDLNNLLPFYRDTLGMKVSVETPGFVVLGDLGGTTVALGTHSEVRGMAKEPQRHIVGLETDDVRAEHSSRPRSKPSCTPSSASFATSSREECA